MLVFTVLLSQLLPFSTSLYTPLRDLYLMIALFDFCVFLIGNKWTTLCDIIQQDTVGSHSRVFHRIFYKQLFGNLWESHVYIINHTLYLLEIVDNTKLNN